MEYKNRNEIPVDYKWNLTDIYPDEASWETALNAVQKEINFGSY